MVTLTIQSFGGPGDLIALNGTEGTPTGTSVTYTDPADAPGIVVTLTGTGISGTPSASWNITEISATINGNPAWTLTGLTGIDGAPTSGAFDSDSIFQAVAFHSTFDLIFRSDFDTLVGSTLIGSPIAHSTALIAGPGNDVLIARHGNTSLDGGGGFNKLYGAKTGHDAFVFDASVDAMTNFDTFYRFNPTRDVIELSHQYFDINHFGHLRAADFHVGIGPTTASQRIIYNHGALFYDADGTGTHYGEQQFAFVPGHPTLTALDFLVI
jgi:Ca2+-binding RTX toxin-like protein